MKKQHNDFDDFLRSKEEQFDIPFKEEYWERASAYIQANRIGFWTKFFNTPLLWTTALIVILGGGAASLYLWNQQNEKPENELVIAANNSDNDDLISSSNDSDATNAASNFESTNSISDLTVQSSETKTVQSSSLEKVKSNTDIKSNSSTQKIQKSKTLVSSNTDLISKQENNSSSSLTNNIVSNSERVWLALLQSKYARYFKTSGIPALPVFEHMTIADNTIPVFYGLPYLSNTQGKSSRKIRELSRGGMFPQLTVSLSGGINIFNTLKESSNANGFISTNPYFGIRASYQVNSKWIIATQLNAIQRGGINQRTYNPVELRQNDKLVRQSYAIQLPVTAGYFLNKKNCISFGVAPMYTLASAQNSFNSNDNDFNQSLQFTGPNGLNRLDVQAVLAYTYRLNKKINIYSAYQHGFTDVTKQDVFINNLNHYNHFVTLGLSYNLIQQKINRR